MHYPCLNRVRRFKIPGALPRFPIKGADAPLAIAISIMEYDQIAQHESAMHRAFQPRSPQGAAGFGKAFIIRPFPAARTEAAVGPRYV